MERIMNVCPSVHNMCLHLCVCTWCVLVYNNLYMCVHIYAFVFMKFITFKMAASAHYFPCCLNSFIKVKKEKLQRRI